MSKVAQITPYWHNNNDKKWQSGNHNLISDEVTLQLQYLSAQIVRERLKREGLLNRKTIIISDDYCANHHVTTSTRSILNIFTRAFYELERLHPQTFGRNTYGALPEITPVLVENIGRNLFKHNDVTWGKIISFLAISSALASDCVRAGQSEIVQPIVDAAFHVLVDSTGSWIDKEGGFDALAEHIRPIISEHITCLGWLTIMVSFLLFVAFCKATFSMVLNLL